MSDGVFTRKVRGKMSNSFSISSASLSGVIADALQRSLAHVRSAAKVLASEIDTNERTASNLLEGRNAPNGTTLIKLMAANDEVFREVLKLAGRDPMPAAEQLAAIKAAVAIMEGRQP